MSSIVDPSSPNEEDMKTKGGMLARLFDHACWLASRSLFLGLVVIVTVYLDIPLRSILEGNVWQQMARERTKLLLDEAHLLGEIRRQLGEVAVCLSTLREAEFIHSSELERTRTEFINASNRFEELFASRKNVLQDPDLERAYYEIRDTSRRIAVDLSANPDLADRRKFSAQADLVSSLASKANFMSEQYICIRALKQTGRDGVCP